MASRPLHTEDNQRAAEVAERFPGWHVWSARKGNTRVATRTGDQRPPDDADSPWTQTVIADTWTDLELQLAVQAQHDAERTYL
jgi:hypothetical protein